MGHPQGLTLNSGEEVMQHLASLWAQVSCSQGLRGSMGQTTQATGFQVVPEDTSREAGVKP